MFWDLNTLGPTNGLSVRYIPIGKQVLLPLLHSVYDTLALSNTSLIAVYIPAWHAPNFWDEKLGLYPTTYPKLSGGSSAFPAVYTALVKMKFPTI